MSLELGEAVLGLIHIFAEDDYLITPLTQLVNLFCRYLFLEELNRTLESDLFLTGYGRKRGALIGAVK